MKTMLLISIAKYTIGPEGTFNKPVTNEAEYLCGTHLLLRVEKRVWRENRTATQKLMHAIVRIIWEVPL